MKFLRLSATLSAAVISLLPGFPAAAQEPDYLCFITTPSGQVLDLSESLCGSKKSKSEVAANSDQAFVEDYTRSVMAYPDVRDSLLATIQQSPDLNIRQAKNICDQLKSGISLEAIKIKQSEEIVEQAGIVNATITNNLATKYYCPELSIKRGHSSGVGGEGNPHA